MALFHKHGHQSNETRMARKEFMFKVWIGAAILLLFGFMYFLTYLGPQAGSRDRQTHESNIDPMTDPALQQLRQLVTANLAAFRELSAAEPTLESVEPLETAIQLQQRVLSERGTSIVPAADLDRLDELMVLRDQYVAGFMEARANAILAEAEQLYALEDFPVAIDKLREVVNIRRDIDRNYSRSSARSPSRTQVLESQLDDWIIRPLLNESEDLRQQALAALAKEDWDTAREKMEMALSKQKFIFEEHRLSRLASLSRLRAYERDWENVQSSQWIHEIESHTERAREALAAEDWDQAVARSRDALQTFRQLAANSPRHPYVRGDRQSTLENLLETAGSAEIFERIRDAEASLQVALGNRNPSTITRNIGEVYRLYNQFLADFPGSSFFDAGGLRRIQFLNRLRTEVPLLQELIGNRLRTVPGHPGVRMLETEVWQDLYEKVMKENPSVQTGALIPVESVTWEEAVTFSRRVGWILAEEVSLPSREIFLAALGNTPASEVPGQSVNSLNSDRVLAAIANRAPNTHGYYDLLGNVAEWLRDPDSELGQVTAIGGSARDNPIRLAAIPEESRRPDERNRFIGFRIQAVKTTAR